MLRQAASSLLAPMLAGAVLIAVGASHRLEAQPRIFKGLPKARDIGSHVATEFIDAVKKNVWR